MPTEPELPLSSDLLTHASALRRLARGILGDDHAAEDVVQETWVRALERPPADPDRADGVRGWLSAVARTLAFRRARGDGRRGAREIRAAENARDTALGASPAEILERRQALARLTAAVLALEEPYQSAILLRFYDDLPPREVAARLGVPLATAKSRLARGLAQLRERVDADLAADGTTPRRAFAFLVGPALPVAPAPTSQATGGGTAAATAGAIAMGINGKIAAGIAAAALLGFATYRTLARDGEPAHPESARIEAAARPDVELSGVDGIPLAAAGAENARERLAAEAPDGFVDATEEVAADPFEFTLEGLVLDEHDLAEPGARIYVAPLGAPRNLAALTDADGRFRVRWRGPASAVEVALQVHGAGGESSALRRLVLAAGRTEVAFSLSPARMQLLLITGSPNGEGAGLVLSADGGATFSFSAQIAGVGAGPPAWAPDFLPGADDAGSFALYPERCPATGGMERGYALQGLATLLQHGIGFDSVELIDSIEMEETPSTTGFTLTGTVRDAAGDAVGDALVVLGTAPGRGDGPRTFTAEDGTFRLEEVEPGTWYARAGGGDRGRATGRVDAVVGAMSRWEPWLERGLELGGRLVDAASGEPLAGWRVDAENDAALVADGTTTDGDGRFSIPNLPRRAFRLLARPGDAPHGAARELAGAVVPGASFGVDPIRFEIDVAADLPDALVRVVDADDALVPGAEVRLWNLSTGRGTRLERVDKGYAAGTPLPPGTYAVEALVPGRTPMRLGPLRLAGAQPADLGELRVAERGEVRIRAEGDAESAERWLATLWEVRADARLIVSRTAGALPDLLKLPEGRYELDLAPNPEHAAVRELLEHDRAPAPRRLAFNVDAGARLSLRVAWGGGSAVASVAPDAAGDAADAGAGAQPTPAGQAEPAFEAMLKQSTEQAALTQIALNALGPRTSCTNCH